MSAPGQELDATFHDLVARLAYLQAHRGSLEAEEAQIKAKLAENHKDGTYTINGKPALSITTGHRFDPTLAVQVLPPELVALCQATGIDSKRAKEVLPPALYAQCQKPSNKPTVQVK